ncbi:MAG TPA: glycosyltransferase family 2 protein [Bryobacteraceae bacterium]
MNRIGVVVVTYNSEREIGPCLDSIPPRMETVVVDNASSDGTLRQVLARPGVRLIANPWNRGFAGGANQGIGALDCECVLLLNPDVELIEGIEALAEACAAPNLGAAGGKLIGHDGRPQTGFMFRRFPTPVALAFEVLGINRLWRSNPVNRRFRCLDADPERAGEVDQPAGAMLMIRREAWRKLGGFDESFRPIWFEDVDFLKRAAAAGYRAFYEPSAVAKHAGAHSISQLPAEAKEPYWYGNLLRYAARHFSRLGRLVACSAVMLGSLLRAILGILRSKNLKSVAIYSRVFRQAGRALWSGPVEVPVCVCRSDAEGTA